MGGGDFDIDRRERKHTSRHPVGRVPAPEVETETEIRIKRVKSIKISTVIRKSCNRARNHPTTSA